MGKVLSSKRYRETLHLFAGLDLTGERVRRRNHEVWLLTNRHGLTRKYTIPISSSDHRAHLNKVSQLKRFAEEKP